jgi:hypothetical protein
MKKAAQPSGSGNGDVRAGSSRAFEPQVAMPPASHGMVLPATFSFSADFYNDILLLFDYGEIGGAFATGSMQGILLQTSTTRDLIQLVWTQIKRPTPVRKIAEKNQA